MSRTRLVQIHGQYRETFKNSILFRKDEELAGERSEPKPASEENLNVNVRI